MLFHFLYFSQCVVCMFGHKKDLQSYKSQSPLQMEIFLLIKISFQELQWTARLDYSVVFRVLWSQSVLLEYVRDNQRLATTLCKVHLKSFHARLAVDYPAYSMVICQVIDKLKLVLLFAAQYLTEWVKIIIFIS